MRTLTSVLMSVLMVAATTTVVLAGPPADAGADTPTDFTEMPKLWTCGAEDWGPWFAQCAGTNDRPAAGTYSIVLNYCRGAEHYFAFPKFRDAGWDLSGADYLEFQVKFSQGVTHRGPNPIVYLRNQNGSFIRIRPTAKRSLFEKASDGEWQTVRVPLKDDADWETFRWLNPSIASIDFFEIAFGGTNMPKYAAHFVQIDDVRFTPEQPAYTPPNDQAADLDVLVIERTPTYERYVVDYAPTKINPDVTIGTCTNKDAKHYPDKGEIVTYTAHVQNKGKAPAGARYVWLVDGKQVAQGTIPVLGSRERAKFEYEWTWDPADHDITFQLTPAAEDYCPRNNELTVRNNAILWKHVIERGTLAEVEQKTNFIGSYSFEDWLQAQARFMNQLFAESKYDFAPNGITARVAIGRIEYVDDGEIARRCSGGPYQIGEQDPRYDGGRGCTLRDTFWNTGEQGRTFLNFLNFQGRPDGAWLHEMSHQNGIIDDYQFITEPEDNLVNGVGFNYTNRGLMGGGNVSPHTNPDTLYCVYAPIDVFAYNVTKAKRRGYFGEYLYEIPKDNTLVVLDENGDPVTNASIKLYQTGWVKLDNGEKRGRTIDTIPEQEGTTDARGHFPLENRPAGGPLVTETGCTLHDNPFGAIHVVGFNGVFLVVVEKDGVERYSFITVPDFNLTYAAGNTEYAQLPVTVKVKGDEDRYWAPPCPDRFYGNKTGLYEDSEGM